MDFDQKNQVILFFMMFHFLNSKNLNSRKNFRIQKRVKKTKKKFSGIFLNKKNRSTQKAKKVLLW